MNESEPLFFTRRDDGSVTVNHFPEQTTASLALFPLADPEMFRVHWEGLKITILGVRYRVESVDLSNGVAVIRREDSD